MNFLIAIIAIPALTLLFSNGCSLVGFLIGGAIDSGKPKYRDFQGWEMMEIKPNKKIVVYMKDKEVIYGKFIKTEKNNPQQDSIFNALVIKTSDVNTRKIHIQDIDYVKVENKRNAAKTGFGIGLTADMFLLGALTMFAVEGLEGKNHSSCPYVYSFDGSGYLLDGEMFSGAFFKAAQRSDWGNLDRLQEKNGVCRLQIINELDETQYVDKLKLMVMDHPKGTRVYPSYSGELYTISQPQPPKKAMALSGADMLNDIRTNDEAFWLANPFSRNPGEQADLTDGILLEFDKPATAASAALVLQVRNTPWSSIVQKELLKLHGENLPQWYETLNNSPEARKLLGEAMTRESALKISIWNGVQWLPAGFVWEVGPAIAKDVVVELNLRNVPGNILKIRLDAAPGVWMVNSVAADFTYSNTAAEVKELSLQKATDHNGLDVRQQLQETDGVYYEMANIGDKADLEYAVPAQTAGMERSYMLKSDGYYTIHVDAKGKGDPMAFNRMLQEPGGFTQYVLRDLNEKTAMFLAERSKTQ